MKRLFFALLATLIVSAPAGAQTPPTPEAIILAAHNACFDVERGSALSVLAFGQGFDRSTRTPGAYVRNIPGLELQLSIADKPQAGGRTLRMCSLGVWGRVPGFARVQSALATRGRAEGFSVGAPTPRAQGGTDQMIYKESPGQAQVVSITINEANDPTKGANYVIIYGWLM